MKKSRKYPEASSILRQVGYEDSHTLENDYIYVANPIIDNIDSLGSSISYTARQDNEQAYFLYALTRLMKPELVIETGVASGFSSAVILSAMKANETGRLISIDYPAYSETLRQIFFDVGHFSWGLNMRSFKRVVRWLYKRRCFIPAGMSVGWAVPNEVKDRWQLLTGESRRLSALLEGQSPDIFIHDSDHSYTNMNFELKWGWSILNPGGIIMADDIALNTAWDEFLARENPAVRMTVGGRFGIAKK